MRPRSSVQGVLLFNEQNEQGDWVPRKYEISSWVTLMPGGRGGHVRDSKKHGGNTIDGSYKARILEFKLSPDSRTISEVLVQHAYMFCQLDLNPSDPITMHGVNCKLPLLLAKPFQMVG